ncbi:unnamed protein product, partial [Trichogramma brassicae]
MSPSSHHPGQQAQPTSPRREGLRNGGEHTRQSRTIIIPGHARTSYVINAGRNDGSVSLSEDP